MFDKLIKGLTAVLALAFLVLCIVNFVYEATEREFSASELMDEYIFNTYGEEHYGELIYDGEETVTFHVFNSEGSKRKVTINKQYYTLEFNRGS